MAPAPLILPQDAPHVVVGGPDPDRVLIVGSGPAAGVGVDSHRTALAGALARAMSARSGRGTDVEALGRPFLRTSAVAEVVRGARFDRFDAVVLMVGLFEAVDLVAPTAWRHQLRALVEHLRAAGAADLRIVLVGMPVPSSVGVSSSHRTRRVDRRARALNRVSAQLMGAIPLASFVAFRAHDAPASPPTERWYTDLSEDVAGVLESALAAPVVR